MYRLYDNFPDVILILNRNNIVYFNKKASTLLCIENILFAKEIPILKILYQQLSGNESLREILFVNNKTLNEVDYSQKKGMDPKHFYNHRFKESFGRSLRLHYYNEKCIVLLCKNKLSDRGIDH